MLNLTATLPNFPLKGNYFVTGTDTEIGKTTVTQQLIKQLALQNTPCYAIKPVTAGLEKDKNGQAYSEDAQKINQFATFRPPVEHIAPFLLNTPCSPHIAANIDKVTLTTNAIVQNVRQTLQHFPADVVLIEGAGGWFTPINANETLADVAIQLTLPVIVVVGIKLGSLNHAILTLQAIKQANLSVAMVVFNQLSSDTVWFDEQVQWLTHYIVSQKLTKPAPIFVINTYQPVMKN